MNYLNLRVPFDLVALLCFWNPSQTTYVLWFLRDLPSSRSCKGPVEIRMHLVGVTGDVMVVSEWTAATKGRSTILQVIPKRLCLRFLCFSAFASFLHFHFFGVVFFVLWKSGLAKYYCKNMSFLATGGWKRKLNQFQVLLHFLSEKLWWRWCRRAQMTTAGRGKYENRITWLFVHEDEPAADTWGSQRKTDAISELQETVVQRWKWRNKSSQEKKNRQRGSDTFDLISRAADFWRHQLSASFLIWWNWMWKPPRYTTLKVPFHKSLSICFR